MSCSGSLRRSPGRTVLTGQKVSADIWHLIRSCAGVSHIAPPATGIGLLPRSLKRGGLNGHLRRGELRTAYWEVRIFEWCSDRHGICKRRNTIALCRLARSFAVGWAAEVGEPRRCRQRPFDCRGGGGEGHTLPTRLRQPLASVIFLGRRLVVRTAGFAVISSLRGRLQQDI